MFKEPFFNTIQTLINKVLQADPNTAEKVAALPHCAIALHIRAPKLTLYFECVNGNIYVHETYPATVHTEITASLIGLTKLGLNPDKATQLSPDEFTISGDSELGQTLQTLLQQFQLDWEAHLARYTGDSIARKISYGLGEFWQWQKNVAKTIGRNLSEYVREEAQLTPSKNALEDFYEDIDTLRQDVDRLEARLNQLQGSRDDA